MTGDSIKSWRLIAATALISIAATKTIELAWESYKLKKEHNGQGAQNAQLQSKTQPQRALKLGTEYDEELFREQLSRNYAFLGEDGMEKVKQQYIVVVGVGGVGSWVVHMLVRSGITKLRIIDFDVVTLSSLNRHSCATLQEVGIPKVTALANYMRKIAPWCEIEPINELWTMDKANELILGGGRPTFVIDCIDNIDTKVDLLTFLYNNKLQCISSMGASTKSDPTRINIGDISTTEEDPLARSVRRRLKKRGITSGIPVVFNAEKPDPRKAKLQPLPDEDFAKLVSGQDIGPKNFRVRILPVLGTMPGIFGLTITTYILTKVSGYPINPIEGKNRKKVYDDVLLSLAGQMTRIGEKEQRVPIALQDIGYIVEEVFRGKSPVSGYSTRLTLSKWDPNKPLSLQNVVLLTKEEQREHERRVLNGGEKLEDVYPKDVIDLVNKRFEEEEYYSQFR